MPSAGRTVIVTVDRIKGIASCAIAPGPVILLVVLIGLTIDNVSFALALDDMRDLPLPKFWVGISLTMLPIMVVIALADHVLGLLEKDIFAVPAVSSVVESYRPPRAQSAQSGQTG